jgi:hypothetical protein
VNIDQNVVASDLGMICGDESDSTHVGRKIVHLVDSTPHRKQAVFELA